MPPRMVKRGAASGPKRTPRASRKAQIEQQEVEIKEEAKVEEEPVAEQSVEAAEAKLGVDSSVPETKKEDEVKEPVEEYEKDERLELDDNEVEYEPEEYDEKEIEQEDVQEVGDEVEEDPEEENEGDEDEEELVDVTEELEGEEDDEHAGEEHEHDLAQAEMVDGEEEDHHEVFKERRKRKEFEVFVGGLDKDATEDDLRKAFREVGEVTEVRLMMNAQTKKNKGFAFLRFATVEQAKQAVTTLKNPVINGKKCGVSPSQDNDTLFLGNICKTWTKEALKEKLKHYGVQNFEDLTLVEDSNNEGMNRGFAFLEFSSRSDAMDAFKCLQKRDILLGVDRPAKFSFADSFIDPSDEVMAQVKTVFIDGLPASWDEDRVRESLKSYGKVEKVELARNMPSAKRKDFGFVTFDTHDSAVTCAKSINNAELGEGDYKAKVRARLSRPLQRGGKGKNASHADYRSGRGSGRVVRGSWGRPAPHSYPVRGARGFGSRVPPVSVKRSFGFRDRRPVMSAPTRGRPVAPPPRSYDRRPPAPSYPKSNFRREYGKRDDIPPPRSRPVADYGSRVVPERRQSYREEYSSRGSGYSDMPRHAPRAAPRRAYVDDGYGQRFERPPPPSYHELRTREVRSRDYDSISGSKRPYAAVDDVPPRYAEPDIRQSRARLDYEYAGAPSQYGDGYGDRLGRSNTGYGSSRSSMTTYDSQGPYSSGRQSMGYGRGSFGGSDASGMYSSSYGGEYTSRGSDAGGSSYSSVYPSRSMGGGSSYMDAGGSGSYY